MNRGTSVQEEAKVSVISANRGTSVQNVERMLSARVKKQMYRTLSLRAK